MNLLKLPLHIQILIALVIGTAVGTTVNPGDFQLKEQGTVEVKKAEDGQEMVLTEVSSEGLPIYTENFADEAELRERYPKLTEAMGTLPEGGVGSAQATAGRLHIIETPKQIEVSYTRLYGDQVVLSRFSFSGKEQLEKERPEFASGYEEFSESIGRKVSICARWIGDIFLRLLKMITVPLIVTSLITGVTGLGDTSRFGAMFGRTMLYYLVTSILAITTGIAMVNIIRPGVGATLPGGGQPMHGEDESLLGVFLGLFENMIPTNPLSSLAGGDFLSIICFSILFGIFIIYTGGEHAKRLAGFFESAFQVMMKMTMAIIRLAPIGVMAFMIFATATQGLEIFKTLAWYMLAVAAALGFHAIVVLPLIVKLVARRSPLEFARAMSPALMTAFSTASSNATLPLTITSVEQRAGVSNKTSSFVLPLGATINMDGTALYEAVAVLFIAQATPGFAMSLGAQVAVAVTALLASVGAAGIPHAGLVMMAIVLQAVGLPLEAQGVIIAVDRVLDMGRTMVNVWSDSCGCAIIDRFENGNASE